MLAFRWEKTRSKRLGHESEILRLDEGKRSTPRCSQFSHDFSICGCMPTRLDTRDMQADTSGTSAHERARMCLCWKEGGMNFS